MDQNNPQSSIRKRDGLDHINTHSCALTVLGRRLSHFHNSRFVHPTYGPFNTVEGFWFYIGSDKREDAFRTLTADRCRKFASGKKTRRMNNFRALILEANYFKITQNEKLRKEVLESTLPFDHYYVFGPEKIIIRPVYSNWLTRGFEEIRTLIKEDKPLVLQAPNL